MLIRRRNAVESLFPKIVYIYIYIYIYVYIYAAYAVSYTLNIFWLPSLSIAKYINFMAYFFI